MIDHLFLKKASNADLDALYDVTERMHGHKEQGYLERCLDLQELGERDIFLGYYAGDLCGYVMLSYTPKYGYYRAHNMPEIQDLNVLPDFRCRGIGGAMVKYCEDLARDQGYDSIGIGVGLTPSYGAAQRLYVKMGYIPDGMGVTYDRKIVPHGDYKPFDDDVSLMLEKNL